MLFRSEEGAEELKNMILRYFLEIQSKFQKWLGIEKSSLLRVEHEMTHYATNRMLGSFRLNIHDELLADFMGFTSSLGFFSADLFFLAMGIDGDCIPINCRFRNYCQELDEDEIQKVLLMSRCSAFNLEKISDRKSVV